jgi:hypothetical protein
MPFWLAIVQCAVNVEASFLPGSFWFCARERVDLVAARPDPGADNKIWWFMNRDCDKGAPWGCSRWDRTNGAGYQFRQGFHSAYRSSALEPAYFHKTEKIR